MDKQNWITLMNTFGFANNIQEFHKIDGFYKESHRKYHNTNHIMDCLEKCDYNEATKNNYELHLAIWYHDVIYKPFKKDNELMSAKMAELFLKKQNSKSRLIKRVKDLIMVTLHNQDPQNETEAYMMDIDISILGSDKSSYLKYTKQIRKEYRLVPWFLYKKKRIDVLEMFLTKPKLYFTEYFHDNLEKQARSNIIEEIELLRS